MTQCSLIEVFKKASVAGFDWNCISTPSLRLLPGPLHFRMIVPVRVSSMGQIGLVTWYDIKSHLMTWFQSWNYEECRIFLYCHFSRSTRTLSDLYLHTYTHAHTQRNIKQTRFSCTHTHTHTHRGIFNRPVLVTHIHTRTHTEEYSTDYTRCPWCKGYRGVMVIVVGNGHDDTSSNPGRDGLHFTLH